MPADEVYEFFTGNQLTDNITKHSQSNTKMHECSDDSDSDEEHFIEQIILYEVSEHQEIVNGNSCLPYCIPST